MLEEEWGIICQQGLADNELQTPRAYQRLTVESCAVFAIGMVVGAIEPLVGVAALTRVGLADIRLVT
jgi:hypothetical protein